MAVRALDDVIDVNFYPPSGADGEHGHRPVGLGVMGLPYALYLRGLAFDSEEAAEFGDEVMEAIAFYAYEASSDLAAERALPVFAGSKWDRGLLPPDTVELFEGRSAARRSTCRCGGRLDWAPLRGGSPGRGCATRT